MAEQTKLLKSFCINPSSAFNKVSSFRSKLSEKFPQGNPVLNGELESRLCLPYSYFRPTKASQSSH